jgi:hypothetical protein
LCVFTTGGTILANPERSENPKKLWEVREEFMTFARRNLSLLTNFINLEIPLEGRVIEIHVTVAFPAMDKILKLKF